LKKEEWKQLLGSLDRGIIKTQPIGGRHFSKARDNVFKLSQQLQSRQ